MKIEFIFKDEEWNFLIIKWIEYKRFKKVYTQLMKEYQKHNKWFEYFYTELEDRLNRLDKKIIIKWIEFFKL